MSQPYITLDKKQWRELHNALCSAEREAGSLFAVLKDGGAGLDALKSVRDALAPAYAQDEETFDRQMGYFDSFRQENQLSSIWSIYELSAPGGFLEKHPYPGATHVLYKDHWGDNEIVQTIDGDTWADLYRAADQAILRSGDQHHIYVESFRKADDKPGYLTLSTGS